MQLHKKSEINSGLQQGLKSQPHWSPEFFSGFLCNCRNCIHNQGFHSRPDAGRNVWLFNMWHLVVHTRNNCFCKFENSFFHFSSGANGACRLAEPLHLVLPNATKKPCTTAGIILHSVSFPQFFMWSISCTTITKMLYLGYCTILLPQNNCSMHCTEKFLKVMQRVGVRIQEVQMMQNEGIFGAPDPPK